MLPKCPRKQNAVVKKLAIKLFPGKTIFEKKNKTNKLSLPPETLKKNIFDFYCSATISSVGTSMEDRHICRDRNNKKIKDPSGKTMKLQKRYICFAISEPYKDKNPAVKISSTSFYNQKPDFIQLRAETPVNPCLCTYHENMRLLTFAVKKLRGISGLINRIVCDKSNPNCMMQKCEICKNSSLWHEFTKEILDENDVKQLYYAQWQKKSK